MASNEVAAIVRAITAFVTELQPVFGPAVPQQVAAAMAPLISPPVLDPHRVEEVPDEPEARQE
jgi:hypothetical protein